MGREGDADATNRWSNDVVGRRAASRRTSRVCVRRRWRRVGCRSAGAACSRAMVRSTQFGGHRGVVRRPAVVKTPILALAWLLAASIASAQDARLRGALDQETLAKVTRLVDSARVESLPVDPLVGIAL